MTRRQTYDEATKVSVSNGDVILDGPGGVYVQMTPDAAAETSDRLLEAAARAQGERILRAKQSG